jgi:hypothetical protein
MSGHDDQVEAPVRLIALRAGLDPLNQFRVRFASGHSQHRRRRINTRHPVTTFGEGTAERAGTATEVEDTTWARSGEGEVEVGILCPRVSEVVNLCDPSVLIVHALVELPLRCLKMDFIVVAQRRIFTFPQLNRTPCHEQPLLRIQRREKNWLVRDLRESSNDVASALPCALDSLLRNVMRATYFESIFCLPVKISLPANYKGINILSEPREKIVQVSHRREDQQNGSQVRPNGLFIISVPHKE